MHDHYIGHMGVESGLRNDQARCVGSRTLPFGLDRKIRYSWRKMKRFIKFSSIRNKLTFWFLVLGMAPLCIGILITYNQQVSQIKKQSLDKLVAIRNLKVKRLESWLHERESDLKTIATAQELLVIEEMFSFPDKANNAPLLKNIRHMLLRHVNDNVSYDEIFILSPRNGMIAVSSDPHRVKTDKTRAPYFTRPMKTREIFISDIYFSDFSRKNTMALSIPILCQKHDHQHIVGILVARVNLKHSLYNLLQDRVGLGKTGESLIVNSERKVLNELRWYGNAPLNITIEAKPASYAAQGKSGVIESLDYRGENVLAAYAHISRTGWGLVVKQDLAELHVPITAMMLDFILLILIALTAILFIAFLTARAVASPVVEMARAAEKMKKGDLSARGNVTGFDEVTTLSESFNAMATALESQGDLRRINDEITRVFLDAEDLDTFRKGILKKLVQVTDSQMGVYFLLNEETEQYVPYDFTGISPQHLNPFDAPSLEGQLGWAVNSGEITLLEKIPPESIFTFRTFTGTMQPRAIITIPIKIQEVVLGVISLAAIKPYTSKTLEILNQPWLTNLTTGLSNMHAGEETAKLALQLQETNQELQSQTAELACQSRELRQNAEALTTQNLALENQKNQLEAANRLKSEFLSNMSHELRTPLNSVMALSRVLLMQAKSKLSAEELNYLAIIERNGKNLLDLINDILDLSKIEAGHMDINPMTFSLRSLLENLLERMEPLALEKKIKLVRHIPEFLPHVCSDEIRVNQILENLLSNAVKFTDQGQVSVAVHTHEDKIEVTINDTGIGIPQNELAHIFEAFRQVDGSASRAYDGTGLGLAIAREAATMLGGKITVESVDKKGSQFTFTLPTRHPLAADVPRLPRAPIPSFAHNVVEPERKTILVVDDDADTLSVIAGDLSEAGYHVITTPMGKEALHMARTHRPFAVTLDIIMPEMDGWELLQHLKADEQTRNIPAIVVSISSDSSTGIALGAMAYVKKTAKKEHYLKEVKRVLSSIERPLLQAVPPKKPRLLMVEDNETAIIQVTLILEQEGYAVDVARGGLQALEYMTNTIPDGIILDLMMPGMDGFQVLEKMRSTQATAHLPVLVLTARDLTPGDLSHLSANNVQQLIQKGDIDPQGLLARIHSMLGTPDQAPSPSALNRPLLTKKPISPPIVPAEPPAVDLSVQNNTNPDKQSRPTLLLVEDNPDNMITLKAILNNQYKIRDAVDGSQGLHLALTTYPDLIVLDMSMPGMDGFSVVRALKKNVKTAHIPVIALTAHAMKGDKEKILGAGCDDYLSKPVDPKKIMRKIKEWLTP